jgi:apolipoprotein D and lipocalin family protein
MKKARLIIVSLFLAIALSACASRVPEMQTVDYVDIDRFMGDWYVIANIPTFLEKGAHNARESYRLDDDGTIATTFTFRADGYNGPQKEYHPRGFIRDTESNARWGMRFVWPLKSDYRIVHLDDDYSQTIIGRQKRDFVWIMAREPNIPEQDYDRLVSIVASLGYDVTKLQRVPQQW